MDFRIKDYPCSKCNDASGLHVYLEKMLATCSNCEEEHEASKVISDALQMDVEAVRALLKEAGGIQP